MQLQVFVLSAIILVASCGEMHDINRYNILQRELSPKPHGEKLFHFDRKEFFQDFNDNNMLNDSEDNIIFEECLNTNYKNSGIDNIINLSDYPIHDETAEITIKLIKKLHNEFVENGIVALPNFLLPNVAETIASELITKRDIMCECNVQHNIYQFDDDDPLYSDLHPRNVKMHSKFYNLPYDDIPDNSVLHNVYHWDLMTRFISGLVYGNASNPQLLYRFDDPLAALTCNVLFNGNIVDWHFDQAPFSVIILLQNGDIGGEYEVAPETIYVNNTYLHDYNLHNDIINEINPRYSSNTNSYRFKPGDLIIHRGIHSIHRVTTVFGDTPRMTAIFTYAPKPGMTLTPSVRETTYCRTEQR